MRKVRVGRASIALAASFLAVAPAGAGKDSPYHAASRPSSMSSTLGVESPAMLDWLLMLGGFGFLGAVSRRRPSHYLHDPLSL